MLNENIEAVVRTVENNQIDERTKQEVEEILKSQKIIKVLETRKLI